MTTIFHIKSPGMTEAFCHPLVMSVDSVMPVMMRIVMM
jgi:hypothetical protein